MRNRVARIHPQKQTIAEGDIVEIVEGGRRLGPSVAVRGNEHAFGSGNHKAVSAESTGKGTGIGAETGQIPTDTVRRRREQAARSGKYKPEAIAVNNRGNLRIERLRVPPVPLIQLIRRRAHDQHQTKKQGEKKLPGEHAPLRGPLPQWISGFESGSAHDRIIG